MTKICSKCNIEKELKLFFVRDKDTGKLHSQCKECYRQNRRSKDHYIKYKAEYIARAKARNERVFSENAERILKYLKNNPCIVCGEADPIVLDFDHRDPKEKSGNISKWIKWKSWDNILKEITKCDVLCSNCHRRKTAKQFGFWKMRR